MKKTRVKTIDLTVCDHGDMSVGFYPYDERIVINIFNPGFQDSYYGELEVRFKELLSDFYQSCTKIEVVKTEVFVKDLEEVY